MSVRARRSPALANHAANESSSPRYVRAARALLLSLQLAACAAKGPASPKPVDAVRAEIDAAEDAEKQRKHVVARTHYDAAVAAAHDKRSEGFARREYGETLATWG